MNLLSYFRPVLKLHTTSPFNHDIRVYELFGKNHLSVNGVDQTGPYLQNIFRQAFASFGVFKRNNIQSILILGVGGGGAVTMLRTWFPAANITCVDIDIVILSIAKTYFGLQNCVPISFVCQDAETFAKLARKNNQTYDLILVDLFVADDPSDTVLSPLFLGSSATILSRTGQLVINYQGKSEYTKKAALLTKELKNIFCSVKTLHIATNTVFLATTQ